MFIAKKYRFPVIVPALLCGISLGVGCGQQAPRSPSRSSAATQGKAAAAPSAGTVSGLTPVTDPATAAQIRELLSLTGASKSASSMVGRMIAQIHSQAPPFFPQDFWTDLTQSFQHLDAENMLVPYYQKYYSRGDATKAIEFYKSPTGKRLVAIQPVITEESQKQVLTRAQQVWQQVLLRHKQEIESLAKKYQQGGAGNQSPQGQPQPATHR